MRAEFSEFTYGYSLVNEIVSRDRPVRAPIFPSLIEEGRAGGFDVRLDRVGDILYLQFKLAEYLTTRGAVQYDDFGEPYYRFKITPRWRSAQHRLLHRLASTVGNSVFYAAPIFFRNAELDAHWQHRAVAAHSVFVSPTEIGLINDDEAHSVCYTADNVAAGFAYFYSEPKKITVLNAAQAIPAPRKEKGPTLEQQIAKMLQNIPKIVDHAFNTEYEFLQSLKSQATRISEDWNVRLKVAPSGNEISLQRLEHIIEESDRDHDRAKWQIRSVMEQDLGFEDEAMSNLYKLSVLSQTIFDTTMFISQEAN